MDSSVVLKGRRYWVKPMPLLGYPRAPVKVLARLTPSQFKVQYPQGMIVSVDSADFIMLAGWSLAD